jgi:hypothetical protein
MRLSIFFYFIHLPNCCGLNSSALLNRNNENKHDYLLNSEEKKITALFTNKCELSCGVAMYALLFFFVVQTFTQ